MVTRQSSYNYDEILACGRGELFGEGNAQLPLPPMLMVHRITDISETGGAFAGERSLSDIEGTRRNMLGERGLDAARFPLVSLRSLTVSGDWPMLVAELEVALHGVSRRQTVPITVGRVDDRLTASGALVLRQTDFGAEPYSLLGGLLAVQDAVVIRFELVGQLARFN